MEVVAKRRNSVSSSSLTAASWRAASSVSVVVKVKWSRSCLRSSSSSSGSGVERAEDAGEWSSSRRTLQHGQHGDGERNRNKLPLAMQCFCHDAWMTLARPGTTLEGETWNCSAAANRLSYREIDMCGPCCPPMLLDSAIRSNVWSCLRSNLTNSECTPGNLRCCQRHQRPCHMHTIGTAYPRDPNKSAASTLRRPRDATCDSRPLDRRPSSRDTLR